MALPAPLQALFDRLQAYNSDAYNASSNPGGFARGGNQKPVDNFIKSIQDFTAFGRGISDLATSAADDAIATAADRFHTGQDRIATGQDREAAAASAVESANQAQKLVGTSATVMGAALGSKTFATQAGKYFGVGTMLMIVNQSTPTTRWMFGTVTAYNATTGALTVNVEAIGPTTSQVSAGWNIYLSGARGAQGAQGPQGVLAVPYVGRSSNTQIVAADGGSLFDLTGTFTQTFATAAALGANFFVFVDNSGSGTITLSGVAGVSTIPPGGFVMVQSNGSALRGFVLNAGGKGLANGVAELDASGRVPDAQSRGVGAGQTWQLVSRVGSTSYQNATGRSIAVSAMSNNTSLALRVSVDNSTFVSAVQVSPQGSGNYPVFAIIPAGHFYQFSSTPFSTYELR